MTSVIFVFALRKRHLALLRRTLVDACHCLVALDLLVSLYLIMEEAEVLTPAEMVSEFDINICAPMVRYRCVSPFSHLSSKDDMLTSTSSKLPFRRLVAEYDTHITTTPMILSREFSRNQQARDADFRTSAVERTVYEVQQRSPQEPEASTSNAVLKHYKPSQDQEEGEERKKKRLVRSALVAQFAANDPVHLAEASELIQPYVDAVDINCGCPQRWAYQEGIGSYLCVSNSYYFFLFFFGWSDTRLIDVCEQTETTPAGAGLGEERQVEAGRTLSCAYQDPRRR